MADLMYRNALRAARELWYDEQNLGELIEDLVQREQRGEVGVDGGMRLPLQDRSLANRHGHILVTLFKLR